MANKKYIKGNVEYIFGMNVEGWAFDIEHPDDSIGLKIIDSAGKIVGSGATGLQRPDVVREFGVGRGAGFSLRLQTQAEPGPIKVFDTRHDQEIWGATILAPNFWPTKAVDVLASSNHRKKHRGTVIIFPPIDWEIRFQRPQYLAVELANNGYEVHYIQPRLYFNNNIRQIAIKNPIPGLHVHRIEVDESISTILDASSTLLANVAQLINKIPLDKKSNQIIMQHPLWYPLYSLSDLMGRKYFDYLDDVAGVKGEHGEAAQDYQIKALSESDVVFATSNELLSSAKSFNTRARLVPNGASELLKDVRLERAASTVTLGYVGALESWFDYELVASVLLRNPIWKLLLIGRVDCQEAKDLCQIKNVESYGEVDHFALPSILAKMTIGLIPFKQTDFSKTIDAVKKYEYLMCGLPVIASGISISLQEQKYVRIVSDQLEFEKAVHLLSNQSNDMRLRNRSYALTKTWSSQLKPIVKSLKSYGYGYNFIQNIENKLLNSKLQTLVDFSSRTKSS